MAVYYLDASAAVKRYVREVGTPWICSLADPTRGHFFYLGRVSEVEVIAALARKRRDGFIGGAESATASGQFRHDLLRDYRVVEMTPALITRASALADTHVLRAYDAVQLAAALEVRAVESALILVSADMGLNLAAVAEGLPVENPNNYP